MHIHQKRIVTVFAKEPVAGRVKTRLTPEFSAEEAAILAAAMLADTLEKLAAEDEFETRLAIAPAEAAERMRGLDSRVEVSAQEGSGLGERMAREFEAGFERGLADSLLIVGSDAPHLPVQRVHEAFEALAAGARVVLGPDEGGGYYLVGMRGGAVPELFTEIEMSTKDMCAQTVALAEKRGLPVALLAPGYDLDYPTDLARLERELAQSDSSSLYRPRRLAALLKTLR